ncbi:MAG: toxin-antitoxin system TumE family protein [Anaerolineae bacterium]
MAVLQGELRFRDRIRLRVLERIDFEQKLIAYYSYTVYRGEERLYWYDPQPHPDDATLASTHPHHKHVPPDIKHNRVPAPGLSFEQPNLPVIIKEIEATLLPQSEAPPAASG